MQFLKSSLLTGLYVLLPLLLLWLGLREIGGLLAEMAEPIADMFPSRYFDDLKWPGVVAAGSKSREPIIGVDLYPTLAELADAIATRSPGPTP